MATSQFDTDGVDDVGLIKLDVLGVRMQSAMAHAVRELARINGPRAAIAGGLPAAAGYGKTDGHVELDEIPHDDEATFAAIRTNRTLGRFQIKSSGQRELIGKRQPDQYEDLIADISLFRPAPMKANMVAPFIDTKHGFQQQRLHGHDYSIHLRTRSNQLYPPRSLPHVEYRYKLVGGQRAELETRHGCDVADGNLDRLERAKGGGLPAARVFSVRSMLESSGV